MSRSVLVQCVPLGSLPTSDTPCSPAAVRPLSCNSPPSVCNQHLDRCAVEPESANANDVYPCASHHPSLFEQAMLQDVLLHAFLPLLNVPEFCALQATCKHLYHTCQRVMSPEMQTQPWARQLRVMINVFRAQPAPSKECMQELFKAAAQTCVPYSVPAKEMLRRLGYLLWHMRCVLAHCDRLHREYEACAQNGSVTHALADKHDLMQCDDMLAEHINTCYDRLYDLVAALCAYKTDKMFAFVRNSYFRRSFCTDWCLPRFAIATSEVFRNRGAIVEEDENVVPKSVLVAVSTLKCIRELAKRYRPSSS